MRAHVVNETAVRRSPRVMQLESIFDVPASEKTRLEWNVDLPVEDRPWKVGLIVGPSGCGKTSIARHLFGDRLVAGFDWSPSEAVIDGFPAELGVQAMTGLLTAVGFGSPPAWMRPFGTLSNGEQFRVTCARALAEGDGLIALDEFTSVVDRQVAKVASHTIAKAVRRSSRQLVAVTCHFDVGEWLQPDWVYQPHTGVFEWRSVQPRPPVELAVYQVGRGAWPLFRPHHYLSGQLLGNAKCFCGFVDDEPVAFTCHVPFPHPKVKNIRMIHRTVVLPDWQGLGIGGRLTEWMAQRLHDDGYRCRTVTAHPARVAALRRSPRWEVVRKPSPGKKMAPNVSKHATLHDRFTQPRMLNTWGFEYSAPTDQPAGISTGNRAIRPRVKTGVGIRRARARTQ